MSFRIKVLDSWLAGMTFVLLFPQAKGDHFVKDYVQRSQQDICRFDSVINKSTLMEVGGDLLIYPFNV